MCNVLMCCLSVRQSASCCSAPRRLRRAAENPLNVEARCLRPAEREGGLCYTVQRGEVEQHWRHFSKGKLFKKSDVEAQLCSAAD